MNILVTGGAGFVGSHITDAFVEEGHQVVVVDNLSSGSRRNVNPNAHFYPLDVRSPKLGQIFDKWSFEVVCHQAAQMNVRRSVSEPLFDASINVVGSLNVFEEARRHNVRKVLFASTGGAVYGEQDYFPADEDHPLRPMSPYGVAKLAAEKYLDYYRQVHGLDSVVLRYSNVYGPRQSPHGEAGIVAIFSNLLIAGDQPVINGDGTQTRDFIYVADVVRANLLALECEGSRTFNVGTGIEYDVNTVFRILRDRLRPDCSEVHGPPKLGEQKRSCIDPGRISTEFDLAPSRSLEDGLSATARWFKQQMGSPRKLTREQVLPTGRVV